MPRNSVKSFSTLVRPILTLGLAAAFIWGFIVGKVDAGMFATTAVGIFSYWFAERTMTKKT